MSYVIYKHHKNYVLAITWQILTFKFKPPDMTKPIRFFDSAEIKWGIFGSRRTSRVVPDSGSAAELTSHQ